MIKLSIPFLPTSLNKLFTMHHMKRYTYFQEWQKYIMVIVKAERLAPTKPFKKARLSITFIFPDNRKRDLDNLIGGCKGLTDGLCKAKVIKDDSWQNLEVSYSGKKGNIASTEVTIREIKPKSQNRRKKRSPLQKSK